MIEILIFLIKFSFRIKGISETKFNSKPCLMASGLGLRWLGNWTPAAGVLKKCLRIMLKF